MTEPHHARWATPARRLDLVRAPSAVAIVVALAVFSPLVGGRTADRAVRAQTDPDPLAHLTRLPLPGDAPLGGHSAVLDGLAMTLLGGERSDFLPPTSLRSLRLGGAAPAWETRSETGDGPQSALVGRGLLGARTVRISADGAAETAVLTLCHCAPGTTFSARWPAAGGDIHWRSVAAAQPLPYAHGLLTFDEPRGRVIAAGGEFAGAGDVVTATWSLDVTDAGGAEWVALPPLPFQRMFQAADRDPRTGHLVAFGGQGPDAVPAADLWRADLAAADGPGAWSDATALAGAGPLARSGATLTFVGDTGYALLIGGYTPGRGELDDVWALDYRDPSAPSWRVLFALGAMQSPRSGHSAVWDGARSRVIVYGGLRLQGDGVEYLDDGFALALDPGAEPTTPAPPATTAAPTATTAVPTAVPTGATTPPTGGRIYLPNALKAADLRAAQ